MSHRKSKRTFVKESTSKSSSASTTRKHVICDCNLCQGASVDPRTRASHMKKVELTRGLASSDRPSGVGTSSTSQWIWTKWKSVIAPVMNKNLIFLLRNQKNLKE